MGIIFSQKGGNKKFKLSKEKFKNTTLPNVLDHIAAEYILTQNFKDLENLHDKTYCNKLIILTSKIIKKYLTNKQITWLDNRIKSGIDVDELKKDDGVIFFNQDDQKDMVEITPLRKQRMCIGISKFYIKIGHLFAAITKTINPQYSYIDEMGEKQFVDLKDKNKTNKELSFNKSNLCSKRIEALMVKQNEENKIIIQNKSCNMNMKGGNQIPNITEKISKLEEKSIIPKQDKEIIDTLKSQVKPNYNNNLSQEIGIPELEKLYWDDYDLKTGKYIGMLPETQVIYLNDVKKFYRYFTGNEEVPDSIKTFSDIPLQDFHKQKLCLDPQTNTEQYNNLTIDEKLFNSNWQKSHGPSSSENFKKYADHMASMLRNAKEKEEKLKDILGDIFVYWESNEDDQEILSLHPELNETLLDEKIKLARNIIVELYIKCEKEFHKGLELFESIVSQKMFDTRKRKDIHLQNLAKKVV